MLKKILAIAIIGLVLPGISQAASFEKNLTYGVKNNDDVRELQEFLKDQKLFTGPITGNYFSLTRSAVIRFQQKNGVKPANGQFSTSSREIAQKLLDPEQNVTEPMDEPSAYLDYPIGTTLQTSTPVVGFSPELSPTPFPQMGTPTVIYYPVFVPQETTGTTSTIKMSSAPVVEGPKDTVAPKPLHWTSGSGGVPVNGSSWSVLLSDPAGKSSVGQCANCVAVVTDEPTTIRLQYIKREYAEAQNRELDGGAQVINTFSDQIGTWVDNGNLSNVHVFFTKPLLENQSSSTVYSYRFSVTDAAGNTYTQKFGNAYTESPLRWTSQNFKFVPRDPEDNFSWSTPESYKIIDGIRTTL